MGIYLYENSKLIKMKIQQFKKGVTAVFSKMLVSSLHLTDITKYIEKILTALKKGKVNEKGWKESVKEIQHALRS